MSEGKIRDGGEEEEEEEEYDTRALYTEEGLGGFCAAGDCLKSETRKGLSNAGESVKEDGWSLVDIEECKSGGDFFNFKETEMVGEGALFSLRLPPLLQGDHEGQAELRAATGYYPFCYIF